jgi:hypothetical protein
MIKAFIRRATADARPPMTLNNMRQLGMQRTSGWALAVAIS